MKKLVLALILGAGLIGAAFGQTGTEDLRVLNRMMKLKMDGLIPLRFANALDGKPIEGAVVAVAGIGNFATDREGIIAFPEQEDGFYTLTFSKAGFISTLIEFEVKLNNVFESRFSMSPVMPGGYFRITLDWGENPSDLDLHFEQEGGYHISFWNMRGAADGSAALDRDDRNGFGPETITVMELDASRVYHVYAHDYTNGRSASSRALSKSGTTVRIYNENQLVHTFVVPGDAAGNLWRVCRIVNGVVE
ncbi:MAG: hypothetical protein LBF60_02460 [Treponema sp.]|jgi:hypothetical protein|nr:hypothetical protein [Treponema sp.]